MNEDGATAQASPDEWISFEMRMRRRRFARCLLRADLALDDRELSDARAALDEARELDAGSADLLAFEKRLAELEQPETPVEPVTDPPRRSWRGLAILGTAAVLLLAAAGVAALKNGYLVRPLESATPAPIVETATSAPLAPTVPAPVGTGSAFSRGLRIVTEMVIAKHQGTPAIVPDEGEPEGEPLRMPRSMAPPIADAEPVTDATVLNAVDVRPPEPPVAQPREIRAMAIEPAPALLPPQPVMTAAAPASLPGAAGPRPEASAPIMPKIADEVAIVRSTLARYENAYSSLDAEAASAVWPGVNRGALARAFDGLASQEVTLGACDVTVNGADARAICSGRARWTPKVGGGQRSAQRRWDFELKKSGGSWQIARASAK